MLLISFCFNLLTQSFFKFIKESLTCNSEMFLPLSLGLSYLHEEIKLVHGDLNPRNILMMKKANHWIPKISDFKICRTTDCNETEDSLRTVGQMEDVVSLGNIFIYMLTRGEYSLKFDKYKSDRDMKKETNPQFDMIDEDAKSLVTAMTTQMTGNGFFIDQVLAHHWFWDDDKNLDFLQKASDFLEDRQKHKCLLESLEIIRGKIFCGNWTDIISKNNPEVKRVLEKRPTNATSLQSLLRQIRNWINHYNDKNTTKDLTDEIGDYPSGLLNFFKSKFPKLVPCLYDLLFNCKKEKILHRFYVTGRQKARTYQLKQDDLANLAIAIEISSRPELRTSDGATDVLKGALESSSEEEEADDCIEDDFNDSANSRLLLPPYQRELANQALNGNNSLIVAPIGSGTTFVACKIISHHLKQKRLKSIVYLTSTAALARHQYEIFKKYLRAQLNDAESACLIDNKDPTISSGEIIKRMKLTVLIPQILINELKRPCISFNDISMMMFDECHKMSEGHRFKVILDMLLDFRLEPSDIRNIQIVGIATLPGVGKGETTEVVMNNLITLMANLNVTLSPARVERNLEDLKKYQNKTEQNFVTVDVPHDRFTRKINEAMAILEKKINDGIVSEHQFRLPPEEKDQEKYRKRIMEFIRYAQLNLVDQAVCRIVVLYAHHLNMYSNLLHLNRMIPNALEVVAQEAEFPQECTEGEIVGTIFKKLDKASKRSGTPVLLKKLFEVLEKNIVSEEKKKSCHCIIFVPRTLRHICTALADAISKNQKLSCLKPTSLSGANEHAESGALKSFNDGDCKILITTSVNVKNLGIQKCNLIIMYNYVIRERNLFQIAESTVAGRFIVLTVRKSDQIERESLNEIYALASNHAINALKLLSNEERENRIWEMQKKQMKDRWNKKAKDWNKQQAWQKWKVLCRNCKALITKSLNIHYINSQHKLVEDINFRNAVTRKPCKDQHLKTAEFYCRKSSCECHIGDEMQYNNGTFNTLNIETLMFQNDEDNSLSSKQWTESRLNGGNTDKEREFKDVSENITMEEVKEAIDIVNSVML